MKYERFMLLLERYLGCIDCEVFIDNGVLVIVSQGIKIDEVNVEGE